MKKYLILLFSWIAVVKVSAQLPTGTNAPDFTVTDLNGQSHNLYTILEQGRVVVLQFMSTNSTVCWGYHNTGSMNQLYTAHGPTSPATGIQVEILFIESDPNTPVSSLTNGSNVSNGNSWTSGMEYPIISDQSVGILYGVSAFPRFYIICPDKKIKAIGSLNNAEIWAQVQTCPSEFGVNNAGLYDYDTGILLRELCGMQEIKPTARLVNEGTNTLSVATISLNWEGNTLQTIDWAGNLATLEDQLIQFDPVTLNGSGNLSIALHLNTPDDAPADNSRTTQFITAPKVQSDQLLLRIRTDAYGPELYWELRDDLGNVLDKGGNELVGPNGGGAFPGGISSGPGAYGNNTSIRDTLDLPGDGCYSLHFVDGFGDGFCCGSGAGYYKLYHLKPEPLGTPILTGGEFKTYDRHGFGLSNISGTNDLVATIPVLSVYPNPGKDQVNIELELGASTQTQIRVLDALGRVWQDFEEQRMEAGLHEFYLQTTNWPAGVYFLSMQTDLGKVQVHKFVIEK